MKGSPARRHLRLVRPRSPLLTPEQLALFDTPRSWSEIATLDPAMTKAQWRAGIIDADEHGWGLLAWTPAPARRRGEPALSGPRPKGTWSLTDRGRDFVARARRQT